MISSHTHRAPTARGRPRLAGLKKHTGQPSTPRTALGFDPSNSDFVFSPLQQPQSKEKRNCRETATTPEAQTTAVHNTPADAATTCCIQWRRDARVLGSLPLVHWGSLGPFPSCALMPPTLFREFLFSVAVGPLSLWVASPGSSESEPCVTMSVFESPPLQLVPPLPSDRRPLTRSPRREVVSGPAHTRGAHSTASGRRKEVLLFRQPYPALTNGGVVYAVVPCGS